MSILISQNISPGHSLSTLALATNPQVVSRRFILNIYLERLSQCSFDLLLKFRKATIFKYHLNEPYSHKSRIFLKKYQVFTLTVNQIISLTLYFPLTRTSILI